MEITIENLKNYRESENKIEFKKGENGNISYNGADKQKPKDRRRSILGYVTALCNEKGGALVIGMSDQYPHKVVGTKQCINGIGKLESDIYRDTRIRVSVRELYDEDKRVLVIEIPSRPSGQVFKFEDVALMRVGEELLPMSDAYYLQILQEQEPDFSEHICNEADISDLDSVAIEIMKQKYAKKQNNRQFLTLSNSQILNDLALIVGNKVTNAAIILLGKENVIRKIMPQAAIMLEYRSSEAQIPFDNRQEYHTPFFITIDKLWDNINLRNNSLKIKEGPYIFDIPYFNEEVVREALNNAITHRDYRNNSEVVIKQYPQKMIITNMGGFPIGINIENILTAQSTPRNRLLADVLSKTGIVERSGQGIDKIFFNTLSEGKDLPDYANSDCFKVELVLSSVIRDKAFAMFIESTQNSLPEEDRLSVFYVLTLTKIRNGSLIKELNKECVKKLTSLNLIEKTGRTRASHYILSQKYYELTNNKTEYFNKIFWNMQQSFTLVQNFLQKNTNAKMGDFVKLFDSHITRKQVRKYIAIFLKNGFLTSNGKGKATYYQLSDNYKVQAELLERAMQLGLKALQSEDDKLKLGNGQRT